MVLDTIKIKLWGELAGALTWNTEEQVGYFEYSDSFIDSKLEPSPLMMPLSKKIYHFKNLVNTRTFLGLPGMIADSLPEKYGNTLLKHWLESQGRSLKDVLPVERLCILGTRGMGALEYEPDLDKNFSTVIPIEISELVDIADQILHRRNSEKIELKKTNSMKKLIQIGTSAGGAKAKAIIVWNEKTNEVKSGQGGCPQGFSYWIIKFDTIANEEHAMTKHIGRIEYGYFLMAVLAGITMTKCRLFEDGERAHFMTERFDRINNGDKLHSQTFCAIAHADRNPVGTQSYEELFRTARELNLGQEELNELFRRMVFNICSRNQDDHTKNHSFLMAKTGRWYLAPAYDLCFSYKPDNQWIDKHQMRCNGKRDNFFREDLLQAALSADINRPDRIIDEVRYALGKWDLIGKDAGLDKKEITYIKSCFREL